MSRFSRFTTDGQDIWIDTSEICSIMQPHKVKTIATWWKEPVGCFWQVAFMFKSGEYGYLNCWCEELANNYYKLLRS
jgi:hypothetical protein